MSWAVSWTVKSETATELFVVTVNHVGLADLQFKTIGALGPGTALVDNETVVIGISKVLKYVATTGAESTTNPRPPPLPPARSVARPGRAHNISLCYIS